MKVLRFVPVILSFVILAAHFSRGDMTILMVLSLIFPLLLFIKKSWIARFIQLCLILGAIEWIRTIFNIIEIREANGTDWLRMAIILGAVSLFTLLSAFVFQSKKMKKIYNIN